MRWPARLWSIKNVVWVGDEDWISFASRARSGGPWTNFVCKRLFLNVQSNSICSIALLLYIHCI